jgi:hypothetical protein
MKSTSLKLLRICVLILGWLLLAGVLLSIWSQVNLYKQTQSDLTGYMSVIAGEFKLERAFESFFSGLGNAFFAFLIAAIVRMIERREPIGIEYANRLMLVCCGSYLINALLQFHYLIQSFFMTLKLVGRFYFLSVPTEIAMAIPAFAPILYAASICILYRHFTTMVQFESEVA